MKKRLTALFAGTSYYKLSAQRRAMLRYVIIGSLAFHVGGMAIFGGLAIFKAVIAEKPEFDATPPMKTYEPRKLELKVKVQKQQRSSSRPSMIPRMVSTHVSDITLPEIKMDPKIIKTSFQPKFKAVTGTGLGVGLGTGYGLGGFGVGVAAFDFFGIRGNADRIAILVDVSVSMVEDERGGAKGYERVKQRLYKVIDNLPDAAMFNVIVFADAASVWEKEMMVATDDHKSKAKLFIRPYNTEGNWGLTTGNYNPPNMGLQAGGGTTRLDLALDAAFENGADTILVISDGLPKVRKVFTADQQRAHAMQRQAWMQAHAAEVQAYDTEAAAATYTEERVWIPPTPARPPKTTGLKEGQQPDPGAPAQPGRWDVRRVGGPHRPRPTPPPIDPGWWTFTDFVQHLKMLHEELYVKKGKKLPVIHAIGYGIDKEGGDFLKALTDQYKGRYRRVARID